MLRIRIFTGLILSCVALVGLFALAPRWVVLAFAAVGTIGAWEWAGIGALARAPARLAYAGTMALLFLLSWLWTREPGHLLILLSIACVWWAIAFLWLVLAPERHQPRLALLCGVPVLVPAFVALGRLESAAGHGVVRGPQIVLWLLLLVIGADIGAFFAGRGLGRRKIGAARESREDLGRRHRRALHGGAGRLARGACISACRGCPASRSAARWEFSRSSAI